MTDSVKGPFEVTVEDQGPERIKRTDEKGVETIVPVETPKFGL